MSTIFAKHQLSECRDVAYELVRTHASLAAACFDLIALFRVSGSSCFSVRRCMLISFRNFAHCWIPFDLRFTYVVERLDRSSRRMSLRPLDFMTCSADLKTSLTGRNPFPASSPMPSSGKLPPTLCVGVQLDVTCISLCHPSPSFHSDLQECK